MCFYHLVYSGRGNQMMDEDVTAEESRRAMDIIIRRTRDFEERGLKKEILTVDNHCDGVYMYLKALQEGKDELAQQIKKYIAMNGGNRSGMLLPKLTHLDMYILTNLHNTILLAMFVNVNLVIFGKIQQILLWQD